MNPSDSKEEQRREKEEKMDLVGGAGGHCAGRHPVAGAVDRVVSGHPLGLGSLRELTRRDRRRHRAPSVPSIGSRRRFCVRGWRSFWIILQKFYSNRKFLEYIPKNILKR